MKGCEYVWMFEVNFVFRGIFLMWIIKVWFGNLWWVFVIVVRCDCFDFFIIKFRFVLLLMNNGFILNGIIVWCGEYLILKFILDLLKEEKLFVFLDVFFWCDWFCKKL